MFPEIFTGVFSLEFLLFSGAIICRRFDVGIYYYMLIHLDTLTTKLKVLFYYVNWIRRQKRLCFLLRLVTVLAGHTHFCIV